jgi:hypothetical protein
VLIGETPFECARSLQIPVLAGVEADRWRDLSTLPGQPSPRDWPALKRFLFSVLTLTSPG